MGVCCSSHVLSAEEFITSLIHETLLQKCEYETVEKDFFDHSSNGKIENKVFYQTIVPKFLRQHAHTHSNIYHYQHKIFEDIIVTDENNQINLYQALLAFFSLVGHGMQSSQNFFNILIETHKSNAKFNIGKEHIKRSLLTYFELNLIVVTNSVYNTYLSSFGNECKNSDIEQLVKYVYTEINLNKFFDFLFEADLTMIKEEFLAKDEFNELFKDKEFIFSFSYLRNAYMEYYNSHNPYYVSTQD